MPFRAVPPYVNTVLRLSPIAINMLTIIGGHTEATYKCLPFAFTNFKHTHASLLMCTSHIHDATHVLRLSSPPRGHVQPDRGNTLDFVCCIRMPSIQHSHTTTLERSVINLTHFS